MISLNVTVKNNINKSLKNIIKQIDKIPQEAYKVFHDNTPKRSGNARRNTKLKKSTIVANYPYAKRLDEGYSKQYPEGMTKPTEEFIKKRLKKILRSKGK